MRNGNVAECLRELSGYRQDIVPLTREEEITFGRRRGILQSRLDKLEGLLNNGYGNKDKLRRVYERVKSAFDSLTRKFVKHGGKMQKDLEAKKKDDEIRAAKAAKASTDSKK